MNTLARRASRVWDEMLDRDFEAVIAGRIPENEDLVPLTHFVIDLKSLTGHLDPHLIERHSSMSASTARAHRGASQPQTPTRPRRNLARSMRRRAVALAASLAMISGMTGLAWAADHAGPGDWLYGLDRALEVIGIGAGGAEERLQELTAISDSQGANHHEPPSVESPGLERAIEVVANNGSVQAQDIHLEVTALLEHIAAAGNAKGSAIADMAKTMGVQNKPSETGPASPGHPGRN